MELVARLPGWLTSALVLLVSAGIGYLIGHVLKFTVARRLVALASKTKATWDDLAVREITRRIPFWCALLGAYVAVSFASLPPKVDVVAGRALYVLFAASLTVMAAAVAAALTRAYGSTLQQALPISSLTDTVAKGAVLTIGLLVILNGLGLSITPILTALGVGGLAVALALQDTLANFFAGIYVTLAGQVRIGDYIKVDNDYEGYVTDIGWRSTRLRMLPNNLVIVPNAKLGQATVINYSLPEKELAVLIEVGVDYDSDLEHVERVTSEVGKETLENVTGAAPGFDPFIRYHTFGDSSINFTVILRAREFVDQYLLKHEFVKRLHRRYAQEGITIPFPIRTIAYRDGAPPARTP